MTLTDTSKPLPPPHLMRLSVASADPEKFLARGAASFAKVVAAYRHVTGQDLAGKRILEWGCGCGRIARHAVERDLDIWGVDINEDAIDWLKENLDTNRFSRCNPLPPLGFEDETFDFIYAGSVITHISIEHQFKWARELRRLVRPGGIVLLTFAGTYHFRNYYARENVVVRSLNSQPFLEVGVGGEGSNEYGVAQTIEALKALMVGFTLEHHVQSDDILGAQDTAVFRARSIPKTETYSLLSCERFFPYDTPVLELDGRIVTKIHGGIPNQLFLVQVDVGSAELTRLVAVPPFDIVETATLTSKR